MRERAARCVCDACKAAVTGSIITYACNRFSYNSAPGVAVGSSVRAAVSLAACRPIYFIFFSWNWLSSVFSAKHTKTVVAT